MKGKKLCIGLLIFFITCLLSLNLFSKASAIQIKSSSDISSITWRNQNTQTDNNLNLINNIFAPIGSITPNNQGTIRLAITKLNLQNQNFQLSNTRKAKFDLFVRVAYQFPYLMNAFSCPIGSNVRVNSCSIEELNSLEWTNKITQYYNQATPPVTGYEYLADNDFFQYFVYHIEIYYPSDNLTTLSEITFQARPQINSYWFLSQYLSEPINVTLGFTALQSYEDNENPQDEAAEKELEDRDNLESQSTSTDTEAGTAGQSAENTGTTLFGAFTQFVSALNNVSGSSCVLPNMQVYSLDLGQMDLCTYDIPPQIMALVSIGMVFIIVPLGIHLVKKMINLYKEITG